MWNKILLCLLVTNAGFAQLPNTDLWLFSLKNEKGIYSVEKGENITKRIGYDNQPCFSEDGKTIYYVSTRDDNQADIYLYNIGGKKSIQFTKTRESEYSPTIMADKKNLASVVVLSDSSQIILPIGLKTASTTIYPDHKTKFEDKAISKMDSVGYFTFLNEDTVLYYKLTSPHSLRSLSLKTGKDNFIASSPVRGFKAINRNEFIYGIKDSSKVSFYRYNCVLQKASKYAEYNSTNEDILWHPQLGLLKSEGSKILRYLEKENSWVLLFDLEPFKVTKITRFTFDNKTKQLVVVDNA
ncbi:MAG: hypothetical protein K0S32_3421 [Bacteroidetes bacterium]|jgi:hypothetical protein|nr:hypothetical protein [Bacteroidota bacterium]